MLSAQNISSLGECHGEEELEKGCVHVRAQSLHLAAPKANGVLRIWAERIAYKLCLTFERFLPGVSRKACIEWT